METLKLDHVKKVYKGKKKEKDVVAVDDFNLSVEDDEFIVFVGPSGCGKSTTLRMIAGLEEITSGNLYLDGVRVNDIEAQYRNIAMVFQNYALYPHMTAYQNMAFGLLNRKVSKEEVDRRIHEAASILNIEELLNRKPKAMSGGERQRVALGRAIVRTPKIFLLDEPLSNLDAKLRASMRVEISRLYERLKTTFIYVTHDQVEAMTMGTRIVVMKKGVMQQVDTPTNLFDYPCNRFVAGFLGTPQMNFYECTVKKVAEDLEIRLFNRLLRYSLDNLRQIEESYLDGEEYKAILGIRPDDIVLEGEIKAKVSLREVLGNETLIYANLDLDDQLAIKDSPTSIVIKHSSRVEAKIGSLMDISFNPTKIHLFADEKGERSIMLTPRSKQNTLKGYLKVVDGAVRLYLNPQNAFLLNEISANDLNEAFLEGMHRVRLEAIDAVKIVEKDGIETKYVGRGHLNGELTSTFDLISQSYEESFKSSEGHLYVPGAYKDLKVGDIVKVSIDLKKTNILGDDDVSIYDKSPKETPLDLYDIVESDSSSINKAAK